MKLKFFMERETTLCILEWTDLFKDIAVVNSDGIIFIF